MLTLQLWPNTAPLTQKASFIALDTNLVDLRCCHRVMEPDNRVVKHSQTYQDSQGCVLEPNHFGVGARHVLGVWSQWGNCQMRAHRPRRHRARMRTQAHKQDRESGY